METTQTNTNTRSRKTKGSPKPSPAPKFSKHLNGLLDWYGHPTTRNVKQVPEIYSKDSFFKDPFTELYTAEEIKKYYEQMLSRLTDMHFIFENIIEQDRQAFATWTMSAVFMGREFTVQGASHLKFDVDGLCEYHRDYFDLSEEIYEQIPVLGHLFRGLKRVLN